MRAVEILVEPDKTQSPSLTYDAQLIREYHTHANCLRKDSKKTKETEFHFRTSILLVRRIIIAAMCWMKASTTAHT